MLLGVSGGLSGGILEFKIDLEGHVGHLGSHLGRLLVLLGHLGRMLGASLAILGALGPILAGSYGKISPDGRSWGRLGRILEASWRRFGQSRHHLERNFGLSSAIEANIG